MADKVVLEAEVKSNIGKQVKATQEWGSAIKDTSKDLDFQKSILIEMEKDLVALEKAQAKMGKGSWQDSLTGTTQKIAAQKAEIKEQKLAIKDMAQQQKVATKEAKKFNKEQQEQEKAMKGSVGQLQLFGVSLNSIKGLFGKAQSASKVLFGSIKAGIMSTGIGALLIAFGSLMTYLTTTKEGMDKLAVVMAKVGAAGKVLRDRISGFGKIVSNIFNKKLSETINDVKENFQGMGEEMKEEVKIAGELEKATQKLRDSENEFVVQKAKTRKEIEKARLLAEDETKSAEERLVALRKALDLEVQTSNKEVEMAKERLRIFEQDMKQSKHTAEDEKQLAALKADIFKKETTSLRLRKRVMTEVNEMENQIAQEAKDREAEKQRQIDEENAKIEEAKLKRDEEAAALKEIQQENTLALIEDLRARALAELEIEKEKEIAMAEEMDNAEAMKLAIKEKYQRLEDKINDDADKDQKKRDRALLNMKIDFAKQGLGAITALAGEESKIGKAAAIAQATVSGAQSVMNAFTTASSSPLNAIIPGYNFAQAGLAAAFAVKQIKDVASAKPPSGGGGGGGGGAAAAAAESPAPQMMSGAFELGGGQEPEPTRAYVVTDEMTDSQNQLSNIRRRATI